MNISRRTVLRWGALAPALPQFFVRTAQGAPQASSSAYDGPALVVVQWVGGNDGLNTVIPAQNDIYRKARPTIGIPANKTLALGGDMGLHPSLVEVKRLVDEGMMGVLQNVGYPNNSRAHLRAREIWETGSVDEKAPQLGWLGRYMDHDCESVRSSLVGVTFGDSLARTLTSKSGRGKAVSNPGVLAQITPPEEAKTKNPVSKLDYIRLVGNELRDTCVELRQATKGIGRTFDYPDSDFGQGLRWTADMITTGLPTRIYFVTLGSFDTHSNQAVRQAGLFSEFGQGLRAFQQHLKKTGQLNRVMLMTFSDFGRQLAENREQGTDHADASVLFTFGGKVRPGLHGKGPDLTKANDGGLQSDIDFRQVYAGVLEDWLKVEPGNILDSNLKPFPVLTTSPA